MLFDKRLKITPHGCCPNKFGHAWQNSSFIDVQILFNIWSFWVYISCTRIQYLSPNTEIHVRIFINSGVNLLIGPQTFSIQRVSDYIIFSFPFHYFGGPLQMYVAVAYPSISCLINYKLSLLEFLKTSIFFTFADCLFFCRQERINILKEK